MGSSTFNFIANMACRSVNNEIKSDLDFSSDSEKEKVLLNVNSEEETTNMQEFSKKIEVNQTNFLAELKNDFCLTSKISELENKVEDLNIPHFDFKLLSKSDKEYQENSSLKGENFLKGCKW